LRERIANYDAERLERTRVFQDVAPRFDNAFYELKNRLDRVHRAISEAIPTGLGYSDNPSLLIELDVRQQLVHTVSFASVHSADTDRANLGALLFYAGIAGGLSEDDRGVLGAIYMIQDNRRKEIPWRDVRRFEVDAPDQAEAVNALATGLTANVGPALRRFVEILDTRSE
jgi:hypothetical protein